MPPTTMDTAWHEPALAMRDEGKDAVEVGEAVGKHPATIRKLFARNPPASTNGHGHDHDAAEAMAHLRTHTEAGPIPGQTTVDDHLEDFSPPEDDPEYEPPVGDILDVLAEDDPEHPDSLAAFRGEAGEAVGAMQPRPGEEVPDPLGYEERLKGTRQLALDFGPSSEPAVGGLLKLKSDSLASGFYGLGDVITGTFTARVVDVVGKERLQRASGEFRMQPQGHVALVTEITVA